IVSAIPPTEIQEFFSSSQHPASWVRCRRPKLRASPARVSHKSMAHCPQGHGGHHTLKEGKSMLSWCFCSDPAPAGESAQPEDPVWSKVSEFVVFVFSFAKA